MGARECCYYKAAWVVVSPHEILKNGYVKTSGGKIVEVGSGRIPRGSKVVRRGTGAIIPGLINAHAHLELCALKGLVPCDSGFRDWVILLLEERMKLDRQTILEFAKKGVEELRSSGCVAVGEISTLGHTRKLLAETRMPGVWFKEYLGNSNGSDSRQISSLISGNDDPKALTCSAAIHGPHTTAPDLIAEIVGAAGKRNIPVSIHLAESEDEMEFITTGKGNWADFLSFRGIRFSNWGVPARSPVRYLEKLDALRENMLAVHLLRCDQKDIEILAKNKVKVCLCPRSNQNLHKRLPDPEKFIQAGLKPCLGTDSLASCDTLSIPDEMAFVARTFESVSPADILAMGTINGAEALGISDRFGTLTPGKSAAMAYAPVEGDSPDAVLENIVHGNFSKPIEPLFADKSYDLPG